MTNPRIEKIKTEIDKAKAKILEYQAKVRALERQKTFIENERIIAVVRGEHISDAELDALMKSLRRPEPTETTAEITELEETHYANNEN
jgi:hypothetical protein